MVKPGENANPLREFCQTSSIKGLARATRTPRVTLRLLWVMAVLVGGSMATYMIYHMLLDYLLEPVRTVINTEQKKFPFPDVTVCNLQPIKSNAFIESEGRMEAFSAEEMFANHFGVVDSVGQDASDLIMECFWSGRGGAASKNVECKRKNFRQVFNPKYFNCYTVQFANETVRPEDIFQLTMTLYIDDFLKAVFLAEKINSGSSMEKGVILAVHDAGTYPEMAKGIYLSPGHSVYIDVDRHERNLISSASNKCTEQKYINKIQPGNKTRQQTGKTVPDFLSKNGSGSMKEGKLSGYPSGTSYDYFYSPAGCFLHCLQQKTIEQCDCISFKYPSTETLRSNLVFCESDDFVKTQSDGSGPPEPNNNAHKCSPDPSACSCLPNCKDRTYTYSFHQARWPHEAYHLGFYEKVIENQDDSIKEKFSIYDHIRDLAETNSTAAMATLRDTDLIRRNFLEVHVRLTDDYVTVTKDEPAFKFESFIGSLGGILNLWIGISFVTLFELVELGYRLLNRDQRKSITQVIPSPGKT